MAFLTQTRFHTVLSISNILCETFRMKHLISTICLSMTVLLGSTGVSFALLPICPNTYNKSTWTNCVGSTILPVGILLFN